MSDSGAGPVLVLFCGLSFAGKSTLAPSLVVALDAERISLDDINAERGLDGGQGIPLEEWAETNRIAHERGAALLAAGRDVVVDDSGTPRFIRDGWREVAANAGAGFVLLWVRIEPELQRERLLANRADTMRNDVVDRVIAEHNARFEAPEGEHPIEVDARDVRDPAAVATVVAALRARSR